MKIKYGIIAILNVSRIRSFIFLQPNTSAHQHVCPTPATTLTPRPAVAIPATHEQPFPLLHYCRLCHARADVSCPQIMLWNPDDRVHRCKNRAHFTL